MTIGIHFRYPLFSYSLNKQVRIYVLITLLIFSIVLSFLSYAFVIEYYTPNGGGGTMSSSEAKVIGWINSNLPENSSVIVLSQDSYRKIASAFSGKILPIFLKGSGAYDSGIWPRDILLKSQLPEAVLYELNELGAGYIFVSEADAIALSDSSYGTFSYLVSTFSVAYYSGNVTVYKVPSYPLSDNANYLIVSGMWNFPEVTFTNVFNETNNATVITGAQQSGFWTMQGIGGNGNLAAPILLNDNSPTISGDSSLKLDVASGGTYSGWLIQHVFSLPQNWAGKNYFSIDVYGNNTGKKIALQLFTFNANNKCYWVWTDNWVGWKTLVFSLNQPDGQVGLFDVSKISSIVIACQSVGNWNNQLAVLYFRNFVVSQAQIVEQNISEQPNLLLLEELLGNMSYSVTPETQLQTLSPGQVYIFPYNPRINQEIASDLSTLLSNGANIIFIDPSFGGSTDAGQSISSTLAIMKYNYTYPTEATENVTQIIFGNAALNVSFPLSESLDFQNSSTLDFLASFRLQNNITIPFIVKQKVGDGTITFINLPPIEQASPSDSSRILDMVRNIVFQGLPPSVTSKTSFSLPIPADILTTFSGSIEELFNNRNLFNNFLIQNDTTIEGNFTVNSTYMSLSCSSLPVISLQIKSENYPSVTMTNTVLSDVQIVGAGTSASNQSKLLMYNYPGGFFNLMNVANVNVTSSQSFQFNNATITFKTHNSVEQQVFSGVNVSITTSMPYNFLLRAQQPTISVTGTLNSVLQGAFIHGNKFFNALSVSQTSISGSFDLTVLYSSGVTFAKINMHSLKNYLIGT